MWAQPICSMLLVVAVQFRTLLAVAVVGFQDGTFVVVALHAGGSPLAILLALGGLASATGLLFTRLCMNSRLVQSMFLIHQVRKQRPRTSQGTERAKARLNQES